MGIACAFIRLSDRNIETLLREPQRIYECLGWGKPAPSVSGFLARLFRRHPPPPTMPLDKREKGDECGVDKAWHAIHYLLTGTADKTDQPLGFLLSGGEPIGREIICYAPARVFTGAQLSVITEQLRSFDLETLRARYNPEDMGRAGVYPGRMTWDEDDFDYLFSCFDDMRTFFTETLQRQLGILIYQC